jgi:hypothetical protein
LRITDPVIERFIYMAQVKDRYQPPVVRKFISYCVTIHGLEIREPREAQKMHKYSFRY